MAQRLSARYKTLRSRVDELRRHFLPSRFSATGVYKGVQQIADSAVGQWKSNRKVCQALLGLILVDGEAKWPHKHVTVDFISTRIDSCHKRFLAEIKDNHGVMEKHVVALFLPLGYDCRTLSPTLLTDLNMFGGKRGATAHSSSAKLVATAIDPKNELQVVRSIVASLAVIDRELEKLLK